MIQDLGNVKIKQLKLKYKRVFKRNASTPSWKKHW